MKKQENPIAAYSLVIMVLILSGLLVLTGNSAEENSDLQIDIKDSVEDSKKGGPESLETPFDSTTIDVLPLQSRSYYEEPIS